MDKLRTPIGVLYSIPQENGPRLGFITLEPATSPRVPVPRALAAPVGRARIEQPRAPRCDPSRSFGSRQMKMLLGPTGLAYTPSKTKEEQPFPYGSGFDRVSQAMQEMLLAEALSKHKPTEPKVDGPMSGLAHELYELRGLVRDLRHRALANIGPFDVVPATAQLPVRLSLFMEEIAAVATGTSKSLREALLRKRPEETPQAVQERHFSRLMAEVSDYVTTQSVKIGATMKKLEAITDGRRREALLLRDGLRSLDGALKTSFGPVLPLLQFAKHGQDDPRSAMQAVRELVAPPSQG